MHGCQVRGSSHATRGDMSERGGTVTLHGMRSPRWGCCAIAISCLVAGCVAGGADSTNRAASTAVNSSVLPSDTTVTPSATDAPSTTLLSTTPPEPTGVPGLDAADPFCAAWAAYGGSVQAISVAAAFGELTSEQVAALEIVAGGTVVAAVAEIEDRWPAEVAAEESAVIDDLLGPFRRRAEKALEAARAAGLGEPELEQLRAAWATALQQRHPDEPVIAIPSLPPALAAAVATAAVSLDAAASPFADDPSLRVDVAAPITYQYLADHCPDLATSGIGDAL